jgi:transcriptional repressor NrdR
MKQLHAVDEVAYVRFASVYRKFKEVKEFLSEISVLQQTYA